MDRFHVIDDAAVILRGKKGVYRQAKVYARGEQVFAAYGGGYVRLTKGGSTGNPDVSWIDLEADGVVVGTNGPKVQAQPQQHARAA